MFGGWCESEDLQAVLSTLESHLKYPCKNMHSPSAMARGTGMEIQGQQTCRGDSWSQSRLFAGKTRHLILIRAL